jgi:hypothetical protein
MIDPRLRYLIAIDREGSFSSAAKALSVTQSAVTKYVAEIEKQIGYTLFYRGRHGATCTDLGRDFLERGARLLEDAEDILGPRTGARDPFASTLKIGICPDTLEWQVVEQLSENGPASAQRCRGHCGGLRGGFQWAAGNRAKAARRVAIDFVCAQGTFTTRVQSRHGP